MYEERKGDMEKGKRWGREEREEREKSRESYIGEKMVRADLCDSLYICIKISLYSLKIGLVPFLMALEFPPIMQTCKAGQ